MESTKNSNFENLSLNQDLIKGVYLYGFKKPSKIQVEGIQTINTGRDCILQSQSGTGKTATYLLGVLNRLEPNNKCQGLVITPTRELAIQVHKVAEEISKYSELKIELCIGGTNFNTNLNSSNLVIGTLGRINHMIKEKNIKIGNLKLLTIDEADEMFADGISLELNNIISNCPFNSQLIFVSATLSDNVFNISKEIMNNPKQILLKKDEIPVELISQYYTDVEIEDNKFDVLLELYTLISTSQAIIFSNKISKVEWLGKKFEENNFPITCIHGKMTSKERNEVVKDFRDGKTRILLTTDLLSRGIDIPQVNLVINYDLPLNKETYIHRIGRCGRFGKSGIAISLVKMRDNNDFKLLKRLKNHYKMNIEELDECVVNKL
jgi:superfamily II DNA/RNA helicase